MVRLAARTAASRIHAALAGTSSEGAAGVNSGRPGRSPGWGDGEGRSACSEVVRTSRDITALVRVHTYVPPSAVEQHAPTGFGHSEHL